MQCRCTLNLAHNTNTPAWEFCWQQRWHNDCRESRGLGFDVGLESVCAGCGPSTFGHTGSTGTLAWADPSRDLVCVVLTTLPAGALPTVQHPRQLASTTRTNRQTVSISPPTPSPTGTFRRLLLPDGTGPAIPWIVGPAAIELPVAPRAPVESTSSRRRWSGAASRQ